MRQTILALLLLAGTAFAQTDRFKTDILVVVAHPDDETLIGSYLARAIFDQHKRVAVIFGTGGGSGGDAQGPEQASALADIREVEAHKALAHFGVMNVFFLRGLDTPGQDVLRSLENWNHGDQLERVVRIVRLTRPEVIMTWLPDVLIGEDHGDHQAASVLATEAFDMAGDPTAFPEQVAAPWDPEGMNNLHEGLEPWQPKKLYYFSDTAHPETLDGRGPKYLATEVSQSRGVPYDRLAAEEGSEHLTQGDSGAFAAQALKTRKYGYFSDPARLILGKSYVPGGVTEDVFTGIQTSPLAYHKPPGYAADTATDPSMELGGPWLFYRHFWAAHALNSLATITTPELPLNFLSPAAIPITVHNPTDHELTLPVHVQLPERWIYWRRPPEQITVAPHTSKTFTFEARTPDGREPLDESITVTAGDLTPVRLRVRVFRSAMPQ